MTNTSTETADSPRSILNDNVDRRFQHWQAVEAKKARLAGYTLPIMGFSVAIATAASGAALSTGKAIVVLPAILAVLVSLTQHAWYLRQVRLFRALGDDVRDGHVAFMGMDTAPYRVGYLKVLRSKTVLPVHLTMVAVLTVCGVASL